LVFRGTLLPLMPDHAMFHFLTRTGVRLLELAVQYRRELARAGGPELSDAEWDATLADAMVFTTVCQLGVLRFIIDRGQVQGTLLPNLRKLLRRMEAVLEGNAARRDVRRLLGALDQRIAFA
jgi:hypothetical protein